MRLLGGTIRPVENLAAILQLALDAGGKWVLLRMSSAADLATDLATEPPELFSKFQVTRFTAIRSTRSSRHSGCSESAAPGPVMDALGHVDRPKGSGRKLPQPSVFFLFTLKLPEPHKQKLSPIGDVSHTLCQAAGLAPKVGRFRVETWLRLTSYRGGLSPSTQNRVNLTMICCSDLSD